MSDHDPTPRASEFEGHSPEPWTLSHCDDGGFEVTLAADGFVVAARASVHHRAAESNANARLIVAAPTLLAQRDALQQEVTLLREARNDSCACEHDGRGSLTTECQEHQAIREQRDALAEALRRIAADETECGCSTHDDDENDEREGDCCNVVGVYCAHCIAGAALALVETAARRKEQP